MTNRTYALIGITFLAITVCLGQGLNKSNGTEWNNTDPRLSLWYVRGFIEGYAGGVLDGTKATKTDERQ